MLRSDPALTDCLNEIYQEQKKYLRRGELIKMAEKRTPNSFSKYKDKSNTRNICFAAFEYYNVLNDINNSKDKVASTDKK